MIWYVPLGSTVAFTASICLHYILGNYGHARGQRELLYRCTTIYIPGMYLYLLSAAAADAVAAAL